MGTTWQFRNHGKATVLGSHDSTVTTITVAAGQGDRFGDAFPLKATVWDVDAFPDPQDGRWAVPSKTEILHITGRTGDDLTVERAQEGTSGLDMTDTSRTFIIMQTSTEEIMGSLYLGWENVKGYGAVGDGIVDDTQAVLDAIDAALDGGTIYFPAGNYNLATWPTAGKENVGKSLVFRGEEESTLIGAGTKSFLRARSSCVVRELGFKSWGKVVDLNGFTSNLARVELREVRTDQCVTALDWTTTAAAGAKVDEIRVQDCSFINNQGRVIYIAADLTTVAEFDSVHILGNYILGGSRGVHVGTNVTGLAGSAPSSEAAKWKHVNVCHNHIQNIDAMILETNGVGVIVYGEDVIINDNVIDGVTGGFGASSENWGIYTKSFRCITNGNTIRNIADDTLSVGAVGIDIKGADRVRTAEGWPPPDDQKSEGPWGYNRTCFANVIDMGLATNLTATGIKLNAEDTIVAFNLVENCIGSGISTLGDTIPHHRIEIIGNHVLNGDGNSSGILMQNPASGVRVDNNHVENHFVGIQFAPTGTNQTPSAIDCVAWSCQGNTLVAGAFGAADGVGIRFNHQKSKISGQCRDIRVSGNHISGFNGTLGAGISFADDDNGDYDNVWLYGNLFRDCRVIQGSFINYGVTPTNLKQELQGQSADTVEQRHYVQIIPGTWNEPHLIIGAAPNDFHVWQDGTNLRGMKGAPASAGDGTVIV